jgi:hypothetical protein
MDELAVDERAAESIAASSLIRERDRGARFGGVV